MPETNTRKLQVLAWTLVATVLALAAVATAEQPGARSRLEVEGPRPSVTCPCDLEPARAPVLLEVRGPDGTFTVRPARMIRNSTCHMAPGGLTCFAGGETCEWIKVGDVWIC